MPENEPQSQENFKVRIGQDLIKKGQRIQEIAAEKVTPKATAITLGIIGAVEMAAYVGASLNAAQLHDLAEQLSRLEDYKGAILLYGKSADSSMVGVQISLGVASQCAVALGLESKDNTSISYRGSIPKSTHVLPALGKVFVKVGEHLAKG